MFVLPINIIVNMKLLKKRASLHTYETQNIIMWVHSNKYYSRHMHMKEERNFICDLNEIFKCQITGWNKKIKNSPCFVCLFIHSNLQHLFLDFLTLSSSTPVGLTLTSGHFFLFRGYKQLVKSSTKIGVSNNIMERSKVGWEESHI